MQKKWIGERCSGRGPWGLIFKKEAFGEQTFGKAVSQKEFVLKRDVWERYFLGGKCLESSSVGSAQVTP